MPAGSDGVTFTEDSPTSCAERHLIGPILAILCGIDRRDRPVRPDRFGLAKGSSRASREFLTIRRADHGQASPSGRNSGRNPCLQLGIRRAHGAATRGDGVSSNPGRGGGDRHDPEHDQGAGVLHVPGHGHVQAPVRVRDAGLAGESEARAGRCPDRAAPGRRGHDARQLGTEFGTNIVSALLAALVLSQVRAGASYWTRVGARHAAGRLRLRDRHRAVLELVRLPGRLRHSEAIEHTVADGSWPAW